MVAMPAKIVWLIIKYLMISSLESLESKCGAKENRDCRPETKFTSFLKDQSMSPQKQTNKQTKNYVYKIFMSKSQQGGNVKFCE